MAGRHHSIDALLSKETLLTVQYMSICETNVDLGKKKKVSCFKTIFIVRWRKKVQVEYVAQSPKDILAGDFFMG